MVFGSSNLIAFCGQSAGRVGFDSACRCFPYPARWRGGEGKLELHPMGIPFAPSADGAALRWRIGCLRTDVADGLSKIRWQDHPFWASTPGQVWEWPSSCCCLAAASRQERSVCPASSPYCRRIYRSHADYGAYPFFFHADKEQCHAADNGYHDRLHRFFGHCPAELLCYGRGCNPI